MNRFKTPFRSIKNAVNVYTSLGNGPYYPIPEGDGVPSERPDGSLSESDTLQRIANEDIPKWSAGWKSKSPIVCAAKLITGTDEKAAEDYILNEAKAHRKAGSTWSLNKGDFDFAMNLLTPLLFEDVSEEVRTRVIEDLIYLDTDPSNFRKTTPKTLGLIIETENHVLMTEGSRYLKAKAAGHSSKEALESKLSSFLQEIYQCGVWEYNSTPYENYTCSALFNLASYGDGDVKHYATRVLDQIFWNYALGSFDYRSDPPFRRKPDGGNEKFWKHAEYGIRELSGRMGYEVRDLAMVAATKAVGFSASLASYVPPKTVLDWVNATTLTYEARISHGPYGSPEVYSSGKGWLLSAGGTTRKDWTLINVVRPTILFTPKSNKMGNSFHIEGSGDQLDWNNTGVHNGVAVVKNGEISVPDRQSPVESRDGITVYEEQVSDDDSICVATFQKGDLTGFLVSSLSRPSEVVEYTKVNRDSVIKPNGDRVGFELHSDPDRPIMNAHPDTFEDFPKTYVRQ